MEKIINLLDKHDIIGWDIDETLINGPNSVFFRSYVKSNPDKKHWLITFRDEIDVSSVWDEFILDKFPLFKNDFAGLKYMPIHMQNIMNDWHEDVRFLRFEKEFNSYTDSILLKHNVDKKEFNERLLKIQYWKASACKEIGATILIDDLEHATKKGCDKYNIDFLNSIHLQ